MHMMYTQHAFECVGYLGLPFRLQRYFSLDRIPQHRKAASQRYIVG